MLTLYFHAAYEQPPSIRSTSAFPVLRYPEAGLHPEHQLELGDTLLAISKHILLEVITHSEYVMLRILRRISKGDTSPEAVTVRIWNGEDWAVNPINDEGDFGGHWPNGFFCERLDELSDFGGEETEKSTEKSEEKRERAVEVVTLPGGNKVLAFSRKVAKAVTARYKKKFKKEE